MGSRKTGQFVSHVFAYLLGALMAKVDQVIRFMRQLEEGYDYTKYEMPVGRNFLKPGASTQGRMGTFLADDDEEGDEWLPDQPETFIPTGMPVATVLPPMRTKGHTRSFVANPRTNRAVSCASTLERVCALSLIANAQVDEIEDQPASLYVGEGDDDLPASHRVDYRAVVGDKKLKVAMAVRPSSQITKAGLAAMISKINQGFLDGFADEAVILTERELTPALGWNSKFIIRSLRGRNEDDCTQLRDRLRMLYGWINIRTLIQGMQSASGWNAVMCLIFDGVLIPFRRDVILPDCPVVSVNHTALELSR